MRDTYFSVRDWIRSSLVRLLIFLIVYFGICSRGIWLFFSAQYSWTNHPVEWIFSIVTGTIGGVFLLLVIDAMAEAYGDGEPQGYDDPY